MTRAVFIGIALALFFGPVDTSALSPEDRQGLRPLPRPDYVRPDKPEDSALYREIFALQEGAPRDIQQPHGRRHARQLACGSTGLRVDS